VNSKIKSLFFIADIFSSMNAAVKY
jgi:hypothetical protein